MKRIILSAALLISCLSGEISLAQVPLIYCPEKIVCSDKNNVRSCSFDSSDKSLWETYNLGVVEKGTYSFYSAYSAYQLDAKYTYCRYINTQAGFNKYIELKTQASVEASPGKDTGWVLEGWSATCSKNPGSPINCPLRNFEKPN